MTDKMQSLSHEGLLSLIDKLLSSGECNDALNAMHENLQLLKHSAWELIPIISKYLSKEAVEKYPGIDVCCMQLLENVVEVAEPEEVLLELIEQAECQENNFKFISLLKPMDKCLKKLTSNRETSIEWCLSTMQDHIVNLPIPENVAVGERRKPKDTDPWCLEIINAYTAVLQFYKPFVQGVTHKMLISPGSEVSENLINHRKYLVCFCLQLLGKPLMHLDLQVKVDSKPGKARSIAEELVTDLSLLIPDLLMFLQYAEAREVDGRCKTSPPPEDILTDPLSLDVYNNEYKVPTLSLGVLYYLVYAEGICLDRVPCVYSPIYVFQNTLYLATALLKRTDAEDYIIPKGLLLVESVLARVSDLGIPFQVLDSAIHNDFVDALTMVSIYCLGLDNRKLSVTILRSYLFKFDMKGRYLLMWNMIECVSFPPLIGYLTLQLKDMIIATMRTQSSTSLLYFNGKSLVNLLQKYVALPPGKIDLMHVKEQVLSALNLLHFLFARDKKNTTGIWDHLKTFEDSLLNPLKIAISSARVDNNRKIKEREIEKERDKKKDEVEPIVNVSVVGSGDITSPGVENNADIYLSFNTLDLMESSLLMVRNCLEQRL